MKKENINSINFIKAICALGIIISHFFTYLGDSTFKHFYLFACGDLGSVCAQIFFMVSGAVLFYNYEKNLKVNIYYKKRWKSIFPMFYIAYISVEISRIIEAKSFYRNGFFPYIFTILGMDGYLSQTTKTYYILGEWFLGMIIILYLIFPIILKRFKKDDISFLLFSVILYVLFLNNGVVNPVPMWSITSCLISFVFGMYVIKNRKIIINQTTAMVALASIFILACYPLKTSGNICVHLMAGYLFIFFMYAGEWVMKNKSCNKIFGTISKYSYAIFLFQHIVIIEILSRHYTTNAIAVFGLLIIDIIVTLVVAVLLTKFTNLIMNGIAKISKKSLKCKQKIENINLKTK
ncbi:MAG: acyltransferase [Clostridia bacterium]|nr:acyltransferase [Clostridia bacterium]